jgi:hypothetical protein
VAAIECYSKAHDFPEGWGLLRLDGQYGTGAVLTDLAGFSYVTRGKDYQILDRAEVQARLHLPPDQQFSRPESSMVRTLYDCPDVAIGQIADCGAEWWSRLILPGRQRVESASPVMVSSMNSS